MVTKLIYRSNYNTVKKVYKSVIIIRFGKWTSFPTIKSVLQRKYLNGIDSVQV